MRGTITSLLNDLAGSAAGVSASARRGATEAAERLALLARGRPADCAALVADGRVVPALAAAVCSRHADAATVEQAMAAAGDLVRYCPDGARRQQQDALVRLGVLDAAVRRLSAGGRCGGAAAYLVGPLVGDRPDDLARAAVAAGALPALAALMGDADDLAAVQAARALSALCVGHDKSPVAAAAVDASAVRALAGLLGRAGVSVASLCDALLLMEWLARTPAGAGRLVADGALPLLVGLLRSPARGVAGGAVSCLAVASHSDGWGAVAGALHTDATVAPAILALLLGRHREAPFHAACVLCMMLDWGYFGRPEARRHAHGLAAAARRAGAVPRLVELLRTTLERQQRRPFTYFMLGALTRVCNGDAATAREALGAGAWPEARRVFVEQDALAERANPGLVAASLSVLADLAPHLRGGAPREAAAAVEPGLVAALARALGRAAAPVSPATLDASDQVATTAGNAAVVLKAALGGADGAQRAAEFVHAGGADHLVRALWPGWRVLGHVRMCVRRARQPAAFKKLCARLQEDTPLTTPLPVAA
jgi:hypothetical protein